MEVAGPIGCEAALRKRALDLLWQKVAEEEAPDSRVHRSPWDKPRRGDIVSIVKKIRALRVAHKQLGMFGDELAEIRLEWKRKRNFMKLLDAL